MANAGPAHADERWYGIYQEGNKLGYSRETVTDDSVAGLTTTGSHTELTMVMGGNRIRIVSEGQLTFDREFTPREFNYRVKGGAALSIRVAGRTDGDTIYVTVLMGKGQRQELQFPRGGMTLAPLAEWQLRGRDLQPGDSFTFIVFDPTIVQNGELTIRVEGRENMLWGDRLVPVTKMTATFAGIAGVSYVDENGVPLLMTAPMGLTLRLEEKELALAAAAGEPVDLMLTASIPVSPPITNPRSLRRQSYRLTGADLTGTALDGGLQHFADGVLTVTIPAEFPGGGLPSSPSPEFLAFDLALDGDHPEVAALAEQLLRESSTNGKQVVRDVITADLDWLRRNIRRELTFSLPRASQVLQMKRGDCNEHATLMTALLRAQHIPARVAAGVVYVDGAFYYHAWTEVWTGETWLPVDPVFGQEIADATHIRLATGDLMAQAGLLNLIGKLRIEPLGAVR